MLKALVTIIIVIISGVIVGTTASAIVKPDDSSQVLSTQSNTENSEQKEQEEVVQPGVPVTVKIPAINVDASIESVGEDATGRMDVPKNDDNTAWFEPGYRPGMKGGAVLAGHFDRKDGSPAVFWDLEKLQEGDEIIVTDDKGEERTFAVTQIAKYPDKSFPIEDVFGSSSDAMLNLITCDGNWTKEGGYEDRIVVYSKLVSN